MTASEYMKARLAQLNGAEFTKVEVTYPSDEFSSYQMENAIKTLIRNGSIAKVGLFGLQTCKYKYFSKKVIKEPKKQNNPWSTVWPEFFKSPTIYGKCRTHMPRD